jgi:rhodanese-related sulfurtransferase
MPASISVSELRSQLAGPTPPTVLDVRRAPAFDADRRMLPGAVRVPPEDVVAWADQLGSPVEVVVYCVHGHQVSQGAAQALEGRAIAARYLEGGIEQWRADGGSTL